MRNKARRYRRAIALLAAPALLAALPLPATAMTELTPELYQFNRPFWCAPTRHRYVLDENHDICGGVSEMSGPGWAASPRAGAIMGEHHYISNYTNPPPDGTETATWKPTIRLPGRYQVWVDWRASHNRARKTPFYLFTDDTSRDRWGNYLFYVDQFIDDTTFEGVKWARLGTFQFRARRAVKGVRPGRGYVKVINGPDHSEGIDGVAFRYVGPGVPGPLRASLSRRDGIKLTWTPGLGSVAHEIVRQNRNTRVRQIIRTRNRYGYLDTKVQPGVKYLYWIRAVGPVVKALRPTGLKSPWTKMAVGLRLR